MSAQNQNQNKRNTNNPHKQKVKPKLKSKRIIKLHKNPYGKLLRSGDEWKKAKDDLREAFKMGPSKIKQWQNQQIEELMIPHLNTQQICTIISKLKYKPSELFNKIANKLLIEFLNNTLNVNNNINNDKNLNKKKLLSILKNSLRFIRIKEFKQLNIEILSRIDIIPKSVLRILSDNKNIDLLNNDLPINIRRQIWEHKLILFDKEFITQFNKIISDSDSNKKYIFYPELNINNNYQLYRINRSSSETLKLIIDSIGSSSILFNRCLTNINKYYLNKIRDTYTNNYSNESIILISNFRLNLSCSLYEHAHQHLIYDNDKIWNIINILNNNNILTISQIDSIYRIISLEHTIAESSILLNIPYIRYILYMSYINLLEDISLKNILPRDSKSLSQLTSILEISSQPCEWYHNKHPSIPQASHRVLFEFDPLLIPIIYIDSLGLIIDNNDNDNFVGVINDDIISMCKDNALCTYILLYYFLYLLRKENVSRCMNICDISIQKQFDCAYWLSLNGLTEIHLICKSIILLKKKLTLTHKNKFIKFLICFVSEVQNDIQLIEPIIDLIQNIGCAKSDLNKFYKELNVEIK